VVYICASLKSIFWFLCGFSLELDYSWLDICIYNLTISVEVGWVDYLINCYNSIHCHKHQTIEIRILYLALLILQHYQIGT
jgi:hypothetical protein